MERSNKMQLNKILTKLLFQKHQLENGLYNSLDAEAKDSFDVIFSYKIKISTMKELIPIYEKILQFYSENPEQLEKIFNHNKDE